MIKKYKTFNLYRRSCSINLNYVVVTTYLPSFFPILSSPLFLLFSSHSMLLKISNTALSRVPIDLPLFCSVICKAIHYKHTINITIVTYVFLSPRFQLNYVILWHNSISLQVNYYHIMTYVSSFRVRNRFSKVH